MTTSNDPRDAVVEAAREALRTGVKSGAWAFTIPGHVANQMGYALAALGGGDAPAPLPPLTEEALERANRVHMEGDSETSVAWMARGMMAVAAALEVPAAPLDGED